MRDIQKLIVSSDVWQHHDTLIEIPNDFIERIRNWKWCIMPKQQHDMLLYFLINQYTMANNIFLNFIHVPDIPIFLDALLTLQ